jgi:hypothetical protein
MAVLMREILKKWYKHVRFISGIPNFQTHPDDFSWLTHPDTALPPVTGLAGSPSRKDPDARDTTGTRIQRGSWGSLSNKPWGPGALADLFALFQSWNDDILVGGFKHVD